VKVETSTNQSKAAPIIIQCTSKVRQST